MPKYPDAAKDSCVKEDVTIPVEVGPGCVPRRNHH
jgi:hypothetical protein